MHVWEIRVHILLVILDLCYSNHTIDYGEYLNAPGSLDFQPKIINLPACMFVCPSISEFSTGRMDPRVGSGRVTILPDFGGIDWFSTILNK